MARWMIAVAAGAALGRLPVAVEPSRSTVALGEPVHCALQ
jgi:hypothetical protein